MQKPLKYGKKSGLALGLWIKLARASATFGKLSADNIRTFGLTEPQFGVLECLGHLGPLTLTSLSKKMLVSNGNVTCIVDHLEGAGIVERMPSHDDRRSTYVKLTQKGEDLFREIFVKHAEFIGTTASVLTVKEQEMLSSLLKKLGRSLQERRFVDNRTINRKSEASL
jgi:MarR family 2-MHQ and catechol resistance regulon transcriptional repressor